MKFHYASKSSDYALMKYLSNDCMSRGSEGCMVCVRAWYLGNLIFLRFWGNYDIVGFLYGFCLLKLWIMVTFEAWDCSCLK